MSASIAVVKVGGSLYDLPNLGPRLRRWLTTNGRRQPAGEDRVVLVPGGGPLVNAIRHLDRRHALGEEVSHWLALRALTVNAHFLASLLPRSCVHGDIGELRRSWENNELPILNAHEFACGDENHTSHLPHSWAVTSDSLAARVAVVLQASRLVLLKSTTIPQGVDWTEASHRGWVDAMFAEVLQDAPTDLRVSAVNLRFVHE